MKHNARKIKVRRRKVNDLAAYNRQFTVSNNTIPKQGLNSKKIVQVWKELNLSRFDTPIYGNMYEMDENGNYHLIEHKFDPTPLIMDHAQPKPLRKKYKKKYYNKGTHTIRKVIKHPSTFPVYICKKMNHVEYMEKLVEHKLVKWERKNPKPIDMFTEDVEKWKQLRETAKERIRDFVVSMYDKLKLNGRFKKANDTYTEEKIAEIKDINGEGHRVNELTEESPLLKKAKKVTNEAKKKHPNLVATNLKDHKQQKGRIILPEAA